MKLILLPVIVYLTMAFQANQTPNEAEKVFSESTILWVKDSIKQDSVLIEEFLYESPSIEDSIRSKTITTDTIPTPMNGEPEKMKIGEKAMLVVVGTTLVTLFLTGIYRLHPIF